MTQWRQVFLIAAGVLVGTNIIYVLTASGEVQPWNDPPQDHHVSDEPAGYVDIMKSVY